MFLLFMGDNYYPEGGAEDLVGLYDTLDAALAAAAREAAGENYVFPFAWANVLDVNRRFVLSLEFSADGAKVVHEECVARNR
jgi:hypothetical protein